MKRSKLNPEFIEWVKPLIANPDESATITRAEYADFQTTIIRDAMHAAVEEATEKGDHDIAALIMIIMHIGSDLFARMEHFLFDDDEPNAADKTDVSDGNE